MPRLSKKARERIDDAVLKCVAALYSDHTQLKSLHFSRPSKFAYCVSQEIIMNWRFRDLLEPSDLHSRPGDERTRIIEASIRRLYRRKKLLKDHVEVPVLVGPKDHRQVVQKEMTCYWPSTVLDEMARI